MLNSSLFKPFFVGIDNLGCLASNSNNVVMSGDPASVRYCPAIGSDVAAISELGGARLTDRRENKVISCSMSFLAVQTLQG